MAKLTFLVYMRMHMRSVQKVVNALETNFSKTDALTVKEADFVALLNYEVLCNKILFL